MTKTLMFSYGSNLSLDRIVQRCPAIRPVSQAILEDWKLVFRNVADVVPCKGRLVYGAIYELTAECEKALDRYEGYRPSDPNRGLYRKVWVRVRDAQGRFRRAMLYRMNYGQLSPPNSGYLDIIDEGFGDWSLPKEKLLRAVRQTVQACQELELV